MFKNRETKECLQCGEIATRECRLCKCPMCFDCFQTGDGFCYDCGDHLRHSPINEGR